MMAATLDIERDTTSGVTDAPHLPAAARNVRGPDGKSQRGDDGGKGIGSSGNDEETEDGSTVCTGDEVERRQGTEDGGGIQDAARRRRR